MTSAHQLCLWDELPRRPGRRQQRPWGMPASVWDSARKRAERAGHLYPSAEVVMQFVPRFIDLHRSRPLWRRPRAREVLPDSPPPAHYEIPVGGPVTPATRRLAEMGALPGVRWEPGTGLVRTVANRARSA